MSTHLSTPTFSTLDHTLQPLGGVSAQLRFSRQAAERFALTQAAAERRARTSRPSVPSALWQRARGALSRPRPA